MNLVYAAPGGGVRIARLVERARKSVVVPAPEALESEEKAAPTTRPETDAEFCVRIAMELGVEDFEVVADADLPKDRTRRSDWALRDGRVVEQARGGAS
jgi:hypothetical protein